MFKNFYFLFAFDADYFKIFCKSIIKYIITIPKSIIGQTIKNILFYYEQLHKKYLKKLKSLLHIIKSMIHHKKDTNITLK